MAGSLFLCHFRSYLESRQEEIRLAGIRLYVGNTVEGRSVHTPGATTLNASPREKSFHVVGSVV
jgi:hypothetical protein